MKLTKAALGTSVSAHVTCKSGTFTVDGVVVNSDEEAGLIELIIEHTGYPNVDTWEKVDASYITQENKYIYFEEVEYAITDTKLYLRGHNDGVFYERRRHPRFVLRIPCAFQAKNSESIREGVLNDISRYGAGLITRNPILNTDEVSLTIFDKINKARITVSGKIVREVKKHGHIEYGLQLEDNKLISKMCYSLQMAQMSIT